MDSIEEFIAEGVLKLGKKENIYYFDNRRVAEIMRDRNIIFFNHRAYKYTGAGYVELSRANLRSEVYRFDMFPRDPKRYISCFTTSKVNEVIRIWKGLWDSQPFDPKKVNEDIRYKGYLVSFRNGLYNVTTDELLPHTPKAFVMERFDFDYDPSLIDDPIRETYQRIIKGLDYDIFFTALGRTLFSCSTPTFAVVLHGRYGTGKSFLYNSVDSLCVEGSCEYFMGNEIDQKCVPAYLLDKVANLTCFASFSRNEYSVNLRSLDRLVRGDQIPSNRKYETKVPISNSTPLWFKVEGVFDTEDFSEGLALRTYSVNCRFDQPPLPLFHTLCDQFENIRSKQWVINEALRMFRRYGIAPFKQVFMDPLSEYLNGIGDKSDVEDYLNGVSVKDAYEDYCLTCYTPQYAPMSKQQFINHIKANFNLDTKHKSIRKGNKVTSANVFYKKG